MLHKENVLICVKARESILIDLAGTLEPNGLNRRDEL